MYLYDFGTSNEIYFLFPPQRKIESLTMRRLITNYDGSGDAGVAEAAQDQGAADVADVAENAGAVGHAAAPYAIGSAGDATAAGFVSVLGVGMEEVLHFDGPIDHLEFPLTFEQFYIHALQYYLNQNLNLLIANIDLMSDALDSEASLQTIVRRRAEVSSSISICRFILSQLRNTLS